MQAIFADRLERFASTHAVRLQAACHRHRRATLRLAVIRRALAITIRQASTLAVAPSRLLTLDKGECR